MRYEVGKRNGQVVRHAGETESPFFNIVDSTGMIVAGAHDETTAHLIVNLLNGGDTLEAVADMVLRAVLDPGSHPEYHFRQVNHLHEGWPTLYNALEQLAKVRGKYPIPAISLERGGLSVLSPDEIENLNRKL